ncbi:MAG TPA: hypothetical protein VFR90_08460 [Methylibium sp.]|uniref:hypothetical protein n=1 Tax=Methylibium sp. TaxID=2067992 RepID=UPI002DBA4C2E|nr:hypothetical protein [Methylibium sp.]HEU4459138.1 hypothetical protein [Methylibium sp.]
MDAEELLIATRWPDALLPGARLRVGTVVGCVGAGPSGHVYRMLDDRGGALAVREYFPPGLSTRVDGRVEPLPQRAGEFEDARSRFDEDGEQLASLDHPGLLKLDRVWSQDGTSYHAMPWCEGRTLDAVLRAAPAPPAEEQLASWLRAMADALVPVQQLRGCHGHLSPSQVMLLDSGRLLVMEFSRTRRMLAGDARESERDPYAALECAGDGRHGPMGPWTDIYALAAIAHFALRGRPPQAPVHRAAYDVQEPLLDALAGEYADALLHGLDCGLALRPRERPRDLPRFMSRMGLHERRARARVNGESLLMNLDLPEAVAVVEAASDAVAAEVVEPAPIGVVDVPISVLPAADADEPPTVEPAPARTAGAAAMAAAGAAASAAAADIPGATRADAADTPAPPAAAVAPEPDTRAEPHERRPRAARRERSPQHLGWLVGLGAVAGLAAAGLLLLNPFEHAAPTSADAQRAVGEPPQAAQARAKEAAASSPIPEPLEPTAAGPVVEGTAPAATEAASAAAAAAAPAAPNASPAAEAAAPDAEVAAPKVQAEPPGIELPVAAEAVAPPAGRRAEPPVPAASPRLAAPRAAARPEPAAPAAKAPPTQAAAPRIEEPVAPASPCPALLARQYIGRPLDPGEREVLKSRCL